ncbi:MAG: adenosylcobinamide-GDP ribazoletransferase [Sphingomonas taxi]|uniref:Adenosylcobinamide-GDP ribazoletransferase n=1 Tax=Sphingomonas taxi TaxID=1549858 RepID=A0A2W5PE21_9SPHN|nr:MAG: adenosylcobinamide-GDP ribazoletransferase [Sphingomonas taxi]
MKRLLIAIGFLTRLPVPRVDGDAADVAAAIRWYPVAGVIVGLAVAGAGWLGLEWPGAARDPWLGALAALVAWVAVTGALHLDGLADVADGVGAAHGDRARMLAVMRDPQVGSFGVVAIGVQLLAKLVLLHALAGDWRVAAVPFAARIAPLAWARWLAPLGDGLGARVAAAVRRRDVLGWGAVLAGGCVLVPPLVAAPLLALVAAPWFRARLGGVNGDAHGAGIEVIETGLLLALVAAG